MSKYYHQKYSPSMTSPKEEEEEVNEVKRAATAATATAATAAKETSTALSSPTSVLSTVTGTSTTVPILSPPPCFSAAGPDDNFQLTPSSYHIDLETFAQLLPNTIRSSNYNNNNSNNNSNNNNYSTSPSQSQSSSSLTSISTPISVSASCVNNACTNTSTNTSTDPIGALFRRLNVSKEDLEPFCFIDEHKNYTRNLIATDDETFTLLLLCWNPGKYSPIHDHPCDGCWMRVCQGCINEVRYSSNSNMNMNANTNTNTNTKDETLGICKGGEEKVRDIDDHDQDQDQASLSFTCTMDTTFEQGQQTFIHDNLGYHKVGNPCHDTVAISMHLYSPPFSECKIWMDQMDASSSTTSRMCNYSEYGQRKSYKMK